MSTPLEVAVIVGSTRAGRRGRAVADWFLTHSDDRDDMTVHLVDLDELPLPERFSFQPDARVGRFLSLLRRADAFVVVTPEYNHSYPASLKHAVDFGKDEWRRKPVAFVSYGGVSGGLRAVEHLRGVFAELHAPTIRDTVSFHGPFNGFGEHGPADPASAAQAADVLLDDLAWWGQTLRSGRASDRVAA